MINNAYDDNDKTPSPSGSQHFMLHAIYNTRTFPRNFGKMAFLKSWKKKYAGHGLMNRQHILPTQLGFMGHCVGSSDVSSLVGTRGTALKRKYRKIFKD